MSELDKNRKKLLQVANDMFFRLGIKSVSMDDIAREMGASKKTLYQLVENKRELILEVLEADACQDMAVMSDNNSASRDAIDEFLRNSRYFIRQMRQVSPTTLRDLQKYYPDLWREQMKAHHDEFTRTVAANIERGMEEGLYRNDLDAEIVAKFFTGSMMMIVDTTIFPAEQRTLTDIIRQHGVYHFNGIVNAFGRDRLEEYLQQEALD